MRTSSGGQKTKGQYSFSQVPPPEISRSAFDRSCGLTTTIDAGYLYPVFIDEILPGDTMTMNVQSFCRLATPIVPVMDNLYLDFFFFFIPNRLLWDNWEKFMGAQDDPGDSTDFEIPKISSTPATFISKSIYDYFGLPLDVTGVEVSALPLRAYAKVFNDWFRDQDIVDSYDFDTDDGPDLATDYTLKRRMKRHDYFTALRPFAQKGPAVELPLGTSAPVTQATISGAGTPLFTYSDVTNQPISGVATAFPNVAVVEPAATANLAWGTPNLSVNAQVADLSSATAATINAIREAFALQKILERDARGGTRYVEHLKAHWGVTSPDFRLQRAEYLGGGTSRITFHPVAQTSSTTGSEAQGQLAAFATGGFDGRGFNSSFVEHGWVLGIASIRADQTYEYGLERMWTRTTRFDHYHPALAHLGEQEVLNQELWCGGDANDSDTLGFAERWAEYRYKPSKITGLMRSYVTGTNNSVNYWHLAQEWVSRPLLNETFIQENPPISRVIAVTTEPHFLLDAFFSYRSVRPMPTYSTPGMVDHF